MQLRLLTVGAVFILSIIPRAFAATIPLATATCDLHGGSTAGGSSTVGFGSANLTVTAADLNTVQACDDAVTLTNGILTLSATIQTNTNGLNQLDGITATAQVFEQAYFMVTGAPGTQVPIVLSYSATTAATRGGAEQITPSNGMSITPYGLIFCTNPSNPACGGTPNGAGSTTVMVTTNVAYFINAGLQGLSAFPNGTSSAVIAQSVRIDPTFADIANFTLGSNIPPPVPEPSSLLLLGTGIGGALGLWRRRQV